jgi:hypothetical protein
MPTYYLSNLNPSSTALGTGGDFEGSTTTQPITNSTTRDLTISTATAQAYFKFYMNNGRVGVRVNNGSGGFTFSTPDTTRSNEFISLLAKEVFGSSEATDLFSNKSSITTSWNSATVTALGLLNGLVDTAGLAASLELVESMFSTSNNVIPRFTLAYNATNADNSNPVVTGSNYAVTGGSGTGAVVSLTATGTTINGVKVTTTLQGGSAYSKGETVTITDGSSNTATIVLNSVQAAMLNGTLSNSAGTEVPLQTGDVLRMLFTIASKSGQTDASGDAVTASQTFFADYTLN